MSGSETLLPKSRGKKRKLLPTLPETGILVGMPARSDPRRWVHEHPNRKLPLDWSLAAQVPAIGRLMLDAVHQMSGDGNTIASAKAAESYCSWSRPFLKWLATERSSDGTALGSLTSLISPTDFARFKTHIDRRVAAKEIRSKTGYYYKGTPLRLLQHLWQADPSTLGPGWSPRHFLHDEFTDDYRQREPYSAAEARRIIDALSPRLSRAMLDVSGPPDWFIEVASYVLLGLMLGIETECLDRLMVKNVRQAPGKRLFSIRYRKPRDRNRSRTKTTNAPDASTEAQIVEASGSTFRTAGGVVAMLLGRAKDRSAAPEEKLFSRSLNAKDFVRLSRMIAEPEFHDDEGGPLVIARTRLRVTYRSAKYVRRGGMLSPFDGDNTPDVAARHYLESEHLRPAYEDAIERAADEALSYATTEVPIVLLGPDASEEAVLDTAHRLDLSAEDVRAAAAGRSSVSIASCRDVLSSPFDKPGQPCSRAFFACLECRNALITRHDLPRVLTFQRFIESKADELSSMDWERRFGGAHRQITGHILPSFSDTMRAEAEAISLGGGGEIHLSPELLA